MNVKQLHVIYYTVMMIFNVQSLIYTLARVRRLLVLISHRNDTVPKICCTQRKKHKPLNVNLWSGVRGYS